MTLALLPMPPCHINTLVILPLHITDSSSNLSIPPGTVLAIRHNQWNPLRFRTLFSRALW